MRLLKNYKKKECFTTQEALWVAFCLEEALKLGIEDDAVPLTASLEKMLSDSKKMLDSIKSREWESLITDVDKKKKWLEEKLEEFSEKELEVQLKVVS